MKLTREKDELVVRIPLKARRFNPYNEMAGENPDTGEMDNIVGVIENQKGYKETGFMYLIDRHYKGKDDDLGDWVVKCNLDPSEFEMLCKKLGITLWMV